MTTAKNRFTFGICYLLAIFSFLYLMSRANAGSPSIWGSPYSKNLTSGVQFNVAESAVVCSATYLGSMRFTGTALEFCNGTTWSTLSGGGGGGTVTNVATGTGLTGGPITTTGTVSLANTAVTAASYTYTSLTVDAQGRLTAASNGTTPANVTLSNLTSPTAVNEDLIMAATKTLRLPNNTFLLGRNTANSANINILKINTPFNEIEFGATIGSANVSVFNDTSSAASIDVTGRNLTASDGSTIIFDWDANKWYDIGGTEAISLAGTTAVDIRPASGAAARSVGLFNGAGTFKANIKAPALAATYTLTLPLNDGDLGQPLVTNGSGVLSWDSTINVSLIKRPDTTDAFDVEAGILKDTTGADSLNADNRTLIDATNVSSADWTNRQLLDTSGSTVTVDWQARQLLDSADNVILDWEAKQLSNSAGDVIADFSTATTVFNLNSIRLPNNAGDPGSPSAGDIYFNTTLNKIKVYNGTAWETVTSL